MDKKEGFGLKKLAKKTLAVIATSLSALIIDQANVPAATSSLNDFPKNVSPESFQSSVLKPQLILKLNQNNPQAIEASHGSHRSHSSHSSHSSHYSSSSSSSYTPPVTKPADAGTATAKPSTSSSNGSIKSDTASTGLVDHALGSRNLFVGCEGTDVKQVQTNLVSLGYTITVDGYFGVTTKLAVEKFQTANKLYSDGIVDSITLSKIQSQTK